MSNVMKVRQSISTNFKGIGNQKMDIEEKGGEKLLSIFKYYCSFGDNQNTTKMKSLKFNKILKDANLIKGDKNLKTSNSVMYDSNEIDILHTDNNTSKFGIRQNEVDTIFQKIIKHAGDDDKVGGPQRRSISSIKKSIFGAIPGLNIGQFGNFNDSNRNISSPKIPRKVTSDSLISNKSNLSILGSPRRSMQINESNSPRKSLLQSPGLLGASSPNKDPNAKITYLDYNNFLKAVEIVSCIVLPDLKVEEAVDNVLNNHLLPLYARSQKKTTMYFDNLCKEKNDAEFVLITY